MKCINPNKVKRGIFFPGVERGRLEEGCFNSIVAAIILYLCDVQFVNFFISISNILYMTISKKKNIRI